MSKILTIQEAQELFLNKRKVTTINVAIDEKEIVLFTDDHCIKQVAGTDHWVPVTR